MDDYGGPTPEQFQDLVASVDRLTEQVSSLRAESQRRYDAGKRMLRLGGVLVAVALVVGVYGAVKSHQATRALDRAEQQRKERTIASCQQTNDFYRRHNALVDNDQETFRIIIRETTSDPARTFAQERLDSYERNKVRLRDCSPKGIEKYLSTTTTTAP